MNPANAYTKLALSWWRLRRLLSTAPLRETVGAGGDPEGGALVPPPPSGPATPPQAASAHSNTNNELQRVGMPFLGKFNAILIRVRRAEAVGKSSADDDIAPALRDGMPKFLNFADIFAIFTPAFARGLKQRVQH